MFDTRLSPQIRDKNITSMYELNDMFPNSEVVMVFVGNSTNINETNDGECNPTKSFFLKAFSKKRMDWNISDANYFFGFHSEIFWRWIDKAWQKILVFDGNVTKFHGKEIFSGVKSDW